MNLINCPACEKELSPQAITCTNCGHKIQDYPAIKILKKVAFLVVIMSLSCIFMLKLGVTMDELTDIKFIGLTILFMATPFMIAAVAGFIWRFLFPRRKTS